MELMKDFVREKALLQDRKLIIVEKLEQDLKMLESEFNNEISNQFKNLNINVDNFSVQADQDCEQFTNVLKVLERKLLVLDKVKIACSGFNEQIENMFSTNNANLNVKKRNIQQQEIEDDYTTSDEQSK
jgi:hypothetical protein